MWYTIRVLDPFNRLPQHNPIPELSRPPKKQRRSLSTVDQNQLYLTRPSVTTILRVSPVTDTIITTLSDQPRVHHAGLKPAHYSSELRSTAFATLVLCCPPPHKIDTTAYRFHLPTFHNYKCLSITALDPSRRRASLRDVRIMLVMRPQPVPLPDYHSAALSDIGTSMAHARSSIDNSVATCSTTPLQASPSLSKRPRLALNTSSILPVFGKGSTSLRLETLSATSPTARNTFKNRLEPAAMSSSRPQRPTLTPLATSPSISPGTAASSSPVELPTSATTTETDTSPTTSTTSISTLASSPLSVSYKLSPSTKSILRNGRNSESRSRRPSFASSRPIFTGAKKVAFRTTLSEEITTSRYTWRHSDLDLPLSDVGPSTTLPHEAEETKRHDSLVEDDSLQLHINNMADSSPLKRHLEEDDEEAVEHSDNDICPVTPVAGRRKKDREWVWTLGPIEPDGRVGSTGVDETGTVET